MIVCVPAASSVVGVQVNPSVTSVEAPYSSLYVSTRPVVSSASPTQYVVFVGAVLTASAASCCVQTFTEPLRVSNTASSMFVVNVEP